MITVIIPLSKLQYNISMSLPNQWLYTNFYRERNVVGIFSNDPKLDSYIKESDLVVIELNWFAELYEFTEIVKHCKRINPQVKILFGGLFSNIHYKEIFKRYPVDFFIKGDNELPLEMLVNDLHNTKHIPNLVTQDFENEVSYQFAKEDFFGLHFSVEWFQSYKRAILSKNYFYGLYDEDQYKPPFFITAKTGCSCKHKSNCTYCFGSDTKLLKKQYGRKSIEWSSENLNYFYHHFEGFNQFQDMTILDNQDNFDYENIEYCDKNVIASLDCEVTLEKIKTVRSRFRTCQFIIGTGMEQIVENEHMRNETASIIEYINRQPGCSIFFYHHHVHNEEYPETAIEKIFPKKFGHNLNWATDGFSNDNDFWNKISDTSRFDEIYDITKKATEKYVLPKLTKR